MKARLYLLAGAIGLLSFEGLSVGPLKPVTPQKGINMDLTAQIQQEKAEIIRLIGTAKADSPAQCRVLPLGHKACGGPETYLAYSVAATDEALLLKHAEEYARLQKLWQQSVGMYSDCAIVPPKQVGWVDGYCVIGSSGNAL